MPGFIKPQLATLKSKVPRGDQWLHEIKFDGYRVQVHLNRGRKKVFTRNGLDWTKRFTEIAGALEIAGEAIIDGGWPLPASSGRRICTRCEESELMRLCAAACPANFQGGFPS